jgi:anti-sigma regulatory factor (Ser/Thr protein kinase)/Na+-translocating ferredoxin:NAD+ oxidoreductase RNF subunit RnfB
VEFLSYEIKSNDFKRAGDASRALKKHLKLVGADAESIRRTMIAAYEAEMNVVIHARDGRLDAHLAQVAIHVDVIDNGPGIPDLELAMKEGYSTANAEARALGFGAGMGLPNIKRSSDRLRVTSRSGLNAGTRVSFTVFFKREATSTVNHISLQASMALCAECGRCLTACPTEAIRIRKGKPVILEHLCIDCGACVLACKPEALTIRHDVSGLNEITDAPRSLRSNTLLIIPPTLLVDCGVHYSPQRVLAALRSLNFADIVSITPYEKALKKAVLARSQAEGTARPVINPVCPAIVNLIELRFSSLLPHLAPFESPFEAVQASHLGRPMVYVVSCPGQRSALMVHDVADGMLPGRETITEYVTPVMARQAVLEKLMMEHGYDESVAGFVEESLAKPATKTAPGEPSVEFADTTGMLPCAEGSPRPPVLVVTGVDHVVTVLEQLENGLLDDVAVIEPYACDGGCFGSPFLQEDYHVSQHRWEEAEKTLDLDALIPEGTVPKATPLRIPHAARPGIRLDTDIALAIEKLGRLQNILRSLPGKNCATCGAPTCTAFAEDIVLGRAEIADCPYYENPKESGT